MKALAPIAPLEMEGLRDFQQDTARYVFQRLFGPEAGSRFLVADEVGLGKTLVARGIIAQVIDHLRAAGDKRIDIVYIASNSAIAAQNIRKLAPRGVATVSRADRLSMLPYYAADLASNDVNLIALTPSTSIDMGNAGGMLPERAASFAALRSVWGGHRLRGTGIANLFAGSIGGGSFSSREERLRSEAATFGTLSTKACGILARALRDRDRARRSDGQLGLDDELHDLAPQYARRGGPSDDAKLRRKRLIRQVREAMAWTGVHLLQPDLVILDEFQRFRTLLDEESDDAVGEITRAMFNLRHQEQSRTTRVLLLSATPYVMHTTAADAALGTASHYEDFLATYRFLTAGLPDPDPAAAVTRLSNDLDSVRTSILDADSRGIEPVRTAVEAVSEQLTKVMVRTERLASTEDHNGMLKEIRDPVGVPSDATLDQYIGAARVAKDLCERGVVATADVMDYWKSAPYTLSYLGGHDYLLGKAMRGEGGHSGLDIGLLQGIRGSGALLPWNRISKYASVPAANGRMEQLWADFFDAGAHRLLWLPPACSYYTYEGRFDAEEARRLTKRLIFSSWALVPTAVSTLTSYEAERRLHVEARQAGASTSSYVTSSKKRHTRHLRFAQGTQSMSTLMFVIPSPALARIADPLELALNHAGEASLPTWEQALSIARDRITAALEGVIPYERGSGQGSAAWYTLAPLLLDLQSREKTGYDPLRLELAAFDSDDAPSAAARHIEVLKTWLNRLDGTDEPLPDGLPPVPDDLEDVLALSALAGPPQCLYRSLFRLFPQLDITTLVDEAAAASSGVLSLFNSWEATRIIDAYKAPGDFRHKVLEYCAEGHLQAVLDEYLSVLVEWRGFDRQEDPELALGNCISDFVEALSVRTTVYDVLVPFGKELVTQRMRGGFAVPYGKASSETVGEQRVESLSLAFNSPFWPFVLTTTSVGQEGLDFHLYCHAVSHWNLPSNPVDLEQREGRVHRYKGHAIRKNVAAVVGKPSRAIAPWQELFERADELTAEERDTQVIPYWVFAPDRLLGSKTAHIERHLPITPYSREASRLDPLMKSVAVYRLAFGQPRQEELVRHILSDVADPATQAELRAIRIDLSPPRQS